MLQTISTSIFNQAKNLTGRYFFGKRRSDNEKIYLTAPSWDCDWYWGFGYLGNSNEHYHLNNYQQGRNISLYDALKADYILNPKIADNLWVFCELTLTAYALKASAEVFGRGGSHMTTNPLQDLIKNPEIVERINKELLPAIFLKLDEILKDDESHTMESEASKLLASWGVSFKAEYAKYGRHFAEDKDERYIFKCTFRRKEKSFSVMFGQSIAAGNQVPSVDMVLDCIQKYDIGSFKDFCGNFGIDEDTKGRKAFAALQREYEKASNFFTPEELGQLNNASF